MIFEALIASYVITINGSALCTLESIIPTFPRRFPSPLLFRVAFELKQYGSWIKHIQHRLHIITVRCSIDWVLSSTVEWCYGSMVQW